MLDSLPALESLDRLLDAAEGLTGLELRAVAVLGAEEDLADTRVAQPLLYLSDWAWGTTLLAAGIRPVAVAGHSLGELAALAVAGAFSVEAGLELVVERSSLMAATAASTRGTMAAVLGLSAEAVAQAVQGIEGVWVANDNTPVQIVISGTLDGVAAGSQACSDAGARRVVPLSVSGAFHSPLMQPAAEAFTRILQDTAFSDTRIPVIQNTTASPTTDAATLRENLIAQIVSPVRWTESMAALTGMGVKHLVEAGPGQVLAGLAKRIEGLRVSSVEASELEQILEEV